MISGTGSTTRLITKNGELKVRMEEGERDRMFIIGSGRMGTCNWRWR